jgi:hypothetical protein
MISQNFYGKNKVKRNLPLLPKKIKGFYLTKKRFKDAIAAGSLGLTTLVAGRQKRLNNFNLAS